MDTQPVTELVKVNIAVPAETAVTTPAFVTVATAGLLLTQVPPVVGDNVVVFPIQILLAPVMVATGNGLTVTADVGMDTQPVVPFVKVNVAVPPETAVTTPASVTVATVGLLLIQVPPVVGDNVVVAPTQIVLAPVMLTTGNGSTVTAEVVEEQLGAVLLVKVNVAVPADTPVTTPAFVTVATLGLLLAQVPPVMGESVVVAPAQIVALPEMPTTGLFVTETVRPMETHPVVPSVKVSVVVPPAMPVTRPALVTVATAGLLLAQVPPVVGDSVVVKPAQMLLAPVMLTTGKGSIVSGAVG